MGSLLSSISTQLAVRSIILGTFFPVVLLTALNILFVGPLIAWPALQSHFEKLAIGDEKWSVVLLTLAATAVTGILYNLNTPIIRLYEGYPWKDSFIGSLFVRRKVSKFRAIRNLQGSFRSMVRQLYRENPQDPNVHLLANARMPLALILNTGFPDRDDLILPTRFGNVIRSFERYPTLAYGMDAIALWPRLVAKLETGISTSIDEAKTSLDFMLHCSFLSLLTGLAIIVLRLGSNVPLSFDSCWGYVWRSVLFFALAGIFYEWAIGRASSWGTQVKAAFDLYRMDLLTKLGYQQKPLSFTEESALWDRISSQLLYTYVLGLDDTRLVYQDSATRILEPTGVEIAISRVIENTDGPKIHACISLCNRDPIRRAAEKVILAETVPEGYNYTLGSVGASSGRCVVLGLKPLTLELDGMSEGESRTVSYTADEAKA